MKWGKDIAPIRKLRKNDSRAEAPKSLLEFLKLNARSHAANIALRHKDEGIWKETSWKELELEVRQCAAALLSSGVGEDGGVLILGFNRPSLYTAILASAAIRALACPGFPRMTSSELSRFIGKLNLSAVVCADQEQVDKIIELRRMGHSIPLCIYDDPRGMYEYTDDGLIHWSEFLRKGEEYLREDLNSSRMEELSPAIDSIAVLLHSSGTTGAPKGIPLTHANLFATVNAAYSAGAFKYEQRVMAYFPIGWIGDYLIAVAASIILRFAVHIPESPETISRDMREVAPDFFLSSPQYWDNILTQIKVGMERTSSLKRRIFDFYMKHAISAETVRMRGGRPAIFSAIVQKLGYAIIATPVKDRFGLNNVDIALTGGEAIGEATFLFYRALGIKLRQVYGQTEAGGWTSIQSREHVRINTVGEIFENLEARISDEGELLIRGPAVFEGYYHDEESTREVFIEDGWLRTGDAAYFSDGELIVLGRMEELAWLEDGRRFVPAYIENYLKFNHLINNALVLGNKRTMLSVLISLDFDAAGAWAEARGFTYKSYADLTQLEPLGVELAEYIRKTNFELFENNPIEKMVILHKAFDPDDGELTRTGKLRRSAIENNYKSLIEQIYQNNSEIEVSLKFRYDSGEESFITKKLRIWDI